jgi:DNA-binding NtrC family response regulator
MKVTEKIMILDDDPEILNLLDDMLKTRGGYDVTVHQDSRAAISDLVPGAFDLVITDLNMPDPDGMQILDHIIAHTPETLCILLTGYGSIPGAVTAVKKGAFDFITKPVGFRELLNHVESALQLSRLQKKDAARKQSGSTGYSYDDFIGESSAIKKIHSLVQKVADTDNTLLVTGASGSGKELIVRTVHQFSRRKQHPFVAVNCGAIPEALLESELFGHEKGAFTGAHKKRVGRFELAGEGTIFLDEVGEMSPLLQVKLLRVLQEKTFERVGGTQSIDVKARIIAATNKNLAEAVKEGTFREDLFYRLNVIPIHVPPLTRRSSDIPLLVDFFLKKFQKDQDTRIQSFSSEAMAALVRYDWPGNVRELENLIKRLIILCENPVVALTDLPEHFYAESDVDISDAADTHAVKGELSMLENDMNLADAVKAYETRMISHALEKSDGVKAKAARMLKIKRTTLVEKIKKHNISSIDS